MRDWDVLNVEKDSSYLILVECRVPRKSFAASSCDSLIGTARKVGNDAQNWSTKPTTAFTHVYFLHLCIPTFIPTIYFRGFQQFSKIPAKSSCPQPFPTFTPINCQGAARWICPMDHRAHAPNDRRRFDTWPGIEQSKKEPQISGQLGNDMGRRGINRHCATTYELQ